jgi:hypothetical protein
VIASHVKYPKKKLAEAASKSLYDNDELFFNLDYLEPADAFYSLRSINFYCLAQTEKNLSNLLDWNKFKKTSLYGEFVDMTGNMPADTMFTYVAGSDVFVIAEEKHYCGLGGIFICPNAGCTGISIESLKNFLRYCLPLTD